MLIGLICLVLIGGSFVLSSSEIAIFSLSRIQLKKIKNTSEPMFRRIRMLLQDSIGLLITILFFNEIINITLGSIITSNWVQTIQMPSFLEWTHLPNWAFQSLLGVVVTTPIVMIFCELTPKVVASRANQLVISLFLPFVYTLYLLIRPLVTGLRLFLPAQHIKELPHLKEDDFITLAEEHTESGHLHETELELIKNVFEMDDTLVDSIATPIRRVLSIPANFTLGQAANLALKERSFSRLPIHGKSKDEIIGVLSSKDFVILKVDPDSAHEPVMSIAKEPLIVSNQTNLDTLFRKMKSKKVQTAFIKNALGKVTGMISIQDILDTLIEEAFDETMDESAKDHSK
jgi:putative hemolysin